MTDATASELNPPPISAEPVLDMDCRAGNCEACIGPPGTRCEHSCHPLKMLRPNPR